MRNSFNILFCRTRGITTLSADISVSSQIEKGDTFLPFFHSILFFHTDNKLIRFAAFFMSSSITGNSRIVFTSISDSSFSSFSDAITDSSNGSELLGINLERPSACVISLDEMYSILKL